MERNPTVLVACLFGLIVSLLLVGVVSHTVLRHFIQLLPAGLALTMVLWGTNQPVYRRVGSFAAIAVLIFWLLIMVLIWLFLLGLASVVSGSFTTAEIALTISIGFCCVLGLITGLRERRGHLGVNGVVFIVFVGLQLIAFRLSMLPSISH